MILIQEDMFYMRACSRCGKYFFTTAKNGKICQDCLTPQYKKYFGGRGIKYISYDVGIKMKGGNHK